MNVIKNLVESETNVLEFNSSEIYSPELNIKFPKFNSYFDQFNDSLFETINLNLSNFMEFTNRISELFPDFFDH